MMGCGPLLLVLLAWFAVGVWCEADLAGCGSAGGELQRLLVLLLLVVAIVAVGRRRAAHREQSDRPRVARLATADDLRDGSLLAARLSPDGLLLGRCSDRWIQVTPTEQRRELGHLLVVGPPRSGKGLLATTQLLAWSHSAIVSDPRGELYRATAGWRARIGRVVVLDPSTGQGGRYDPLQGRTDTMSLRAIAALILQDPADERSGGTVYTQRATEVLVVLFRAAQREGVPGLVYVGRVLELGLARTILRLASSHADLARDLVGDDLNSWRRDGLLTGAWALLSGRCGALLDPAALRTFSGSDLSPADFGASLPITVYCRWPEATAEARGPLVRALLLGLLREVLAYRDTRSTPGPPLLALVDEAGAIALPALDELASTSAARLVSLCIMLQSTAQLEASYGEAKAQAIREAMHHQVHYRPSDQRAAEDLEQRIGYTLALRRTRSTARPLLSLPMWMSGTQELFHPLLPASHLLTLDDQQVVVLTRGVPPALLDRVDWRGDGDLAGRTGRQSPVIGTLPEAPPLPSSAEGDSSPAEDHNRAGYTAAQPQVTSLVDPLRLAVRRQIGPADKDGCRPWRASFDRDGYPRQWVADQRKWRSAHRLLLSWESEIPPGHEAHHTCGHRWCMEIAHLVAVPRAEHRRLERERRVAEALA